MYFSLKYLYLFSVISVGFLLSACSSDISENPDNGRGTEVSFAVPDISRASTTTSIDRFAVYGDMKSMGEPSSSPSIIFDKTEVVKKDESWQYQDTRYWFPNHEHSFVAIHPLEVLDAARYADSKLSFTYTLPNSNDDVCDIIAATHRRLYHEGDAAAPVFFQFGHLLSLINFTLELTGPATEGEESFKIHKLEMKGFGTSATINITPAQRVGNPQTGDSKIDIVTAGGDGFLTVVFDEPIEVSSGAQAISMFDSNNAIIMLPRTFEGDEEVQINLTYTANDEAEETQVSASLSGFTWESGKSYNYRIKLELEQKEVNMVISNATITPWTLIDDHDRVDAK